MGLRREETAGLCSPQLRRFSPSERKRGSFREKKGRTNGGGAKKKHATRIYLRQLRREVSCKPREREETGACGTDFASICPAHPPRWSFVNTAVEQREQLNEVEAPRVASTSTPVGNQGGRRQERAIEQLFAFVRNQLGARRSWAERSEGKGNKCVSSLLLCSRINKTR